MRGENEVTQVVFDVSIPKRDHGDGTAVLVARREPDDAAYPVTMTQEGDTYTWLVTNVDTACAGDGECEIFWYVGDRLAKSEVYTTKVLRDIGDPSSEPPDPYQSMIDTMARLAAETEQNAADAADSASDAEGAKEAAAHSAEEAAASAAAIEGLPPGGTVGQVLAKKSDTDYDVEWVDQSGGGGGGTLAPATTSTLGGIIVGDDLLVTAEGRLSVDKTDSFSADNTKPVTAAAVYGQIGNINALLATI